ncbi:relaxase/mobilization nuclease domain-containing protein [uncultured Tateyamaria sp.]|uniref:relaxase/mobilization nuclease domain-containing protein n=1 Tax=uncultured Tateyamaria sp. TaxID=455651 RepID=UPI00262C56F4|nr:relaxase/mobilization nuclease domain-containing protein [uncultured Tateyamaria sp.]
MFKKIRNAGTHHPKQLAGQMAYVNGKAELVFGNGVSYEAGDAALSLEAVEEMIEDWSEGWKGQPKNGQTTHLVLSFPAYVTGEQAAAITEEWCYEMFQSVDGGLDEWSYYAALHTDVPHHPHVHVIVNNRGVRHGDWFYMAEGHDFSYQSMRQRMVEIAEPYGVYMDATSRLERGVIEYAPSDAEYRRSIRMGIEPKGRAREGEALNTAYEKLNAYAEQCREMADIAEGIEHIDMAEKLRAAATDLEEARPIYVSGGRKMEIDLNQHPADIRDALNQWATANEPKLAQLSAEDRREVTEQLYKTLDHIETVLDRDYQVNWTPDAARMPAYSQPFANAVAGDTQALEKLSYEYAAYIDPPQVEGITATTDAWLDNFWGGEFLNDYISTGKVPEEYGAALEAVEAAYSDLSNGSLADGREAMLQIRERATAAGLDPDEIESRMTRGAENARDEEEWSVSDMEKVIAHEGLDGTNDADITKATSILSGVHDFIAERMDELYNRHREVNNIELRATAHQVAREVTSYGTAAFDGPEAERHFLEQMRATYGQVGIAEIASGGHDHLKDITQDEQQQRDIALTILKLEKKHNVVELDSATVQTGIDQYTPSVGHEQDGHSI